jgi:hypothetical protein
MNLMNPINPINPLPLLHKKMMDQSFYLYYQNDLVQRYENLRSQVLENLNLTSRPARPARRAMGYVLFLRQGMLVWMENCATSATLATSATSATGATGATGVTSCPFGKCA